MVHVVSLKGCYAFKFLKSIRISWNLSFRKIKQYPNLCVKYFWLDVPPVSHDSGRGTVISTSNILRDNDIYIKTIFIFLVYFLLKI